MKLLNVTAVSVISLAVVVQGTYDYTTQYGFGKLSALVAACNVTIGAITAELVISGTGHVAILLDISEDLAESAKDAMNECLGENGFGIPIGKKYDDWKEFFVSDTFSMSGPDHLSSNRTFTHRSDASIYQQEMNIRPQDMLDLGRPRTE
ncbi:uncharacterized protein V2V93DRAFT_145583 [Kockiozyma suomiensis]|uniref:uncharacterized protein n=1 Tax=Kockiozyma suomiensis TaxID=1337062 RepID=UPI003343E248